MKKNLFILLKAKLRTTRTKHFFSLYLKLPFNETVTPRFEMMVESFAGILRVKLTWGRCYDHNFMRFLTTFGEKIRVFLKNNAMIKFSKKLAAF
jgi:hypothetical protein